MVAECRWLLVLRLVVAAPALVARRCGPWNILPGQQRLPVRFRRTVGPWPRWRATALRWPAVRRRSTVGSPTAIGAGRLGRTIAPRLSVSGRRTARRLRAPGAIATRWTGRLAAPRAVATRWTGRLAAPRAIATRWTGRLAAPRAIATRWTGRLAAPRAITTWWTGRLGTPWPVATR